MATFADFVQDFSQQAIRDQLGPALALITPGHWARFIAWGADHGYTITYADIQNVLTTQNALQAFAASPSFSGWSAESLSAAAAAAGQPLA